MIRSASLEVKNKNSQVSEPGYPEQLRGQLFAFIRLDDSLGNHQDEISRRGADLT